MLHLLQGLGLSRAGSSDLRRESEALVALVWFPFALAWLADVIRTRGVPPIFLDIALQVRLLVAVPLLHVAYVLLERRCADSLHRLVEEGFAPQEPVSLILARERSWSGSWAMRLLPLAIGLLLGQSLYWAGFAITPIAHMEGAGWREPAVVWYAWIALPVFYALLLRISFRWLVWVGSLARIGRIRLHTIALHPDLVGGIAFLARPSMAFAIPIFALSSVLAGAWGTEIAFRGASISRFVQPLVAWSVLSLAVTLGPLLVLTPNVLRMRIQGHLDYGGLAARYTHAFAARWLRSESRKGLLGSPDIQSLADLGGSFEVVRRTRVVIFGWEQVLWVLASVLGPMIPLILASLGLVEVLRKLADAILR